MVGKFLTKYEDYELFHAIMYHDSLHNENKIYGHGYVNLTGRDKLVYFETCWFHPIYKIIYTQTGNKIISSIQPQHGWTEEMVKPK